MTDTPMKLIVNCETGEQTLEPLTTEEIAEMEAQAIEAEARRAAEEEANQIKAELKASAIAKLAALGLTEEEATAFASN